MPANQIDLDGKKLELNARPDRLDLRDRPYNPPLVPLREEYPSKEDIARFLDYYEPLILDQRAEGACIGFGLAAVINYQHWVRRFAIPFTRRLREGAPDEKIKSDFFEFDKNDSAFTKRRKIARAVKSNLVSTRMLYQMARLYDEWDGEDYSGSSCRGAMRGWFHHGVCLEQHWHYKHPGNLFEDAATPAERDGWLRDAGTRPLGAYYRIAADSIPDMQAAIQQVQAIFVSAQIHTGWTSQPVAGRSQVDRDADTPEAINWTGRQTPLGVHAFALVGYTPAGFIVQNSWGRRWGTRGFAILRYDDWRANGIDAWASVHGARTDMDLPAKTKSIGALRTAAMRGRGVTDENYHQRTQPWDHNVSAQHSIVIGKSGRTPSRLVHAEDGAEHQLICARKLPLRYLKATHDYNHLVVFAHSGLDSEAKTLQRTSVIGPWLMANGIYPLFLSSTADMLGDIGTQLRDVVGAQQGGRGGNLSPSQLNRQIEATNDYTWEAIASGTAIRAIWTELKESAVLATEKGGGLDLLAGHLEHLRGQYRELKIHLLGHSAGAYFLGGLLGCLRDRKVPVRTATLWAPACTMQFAHQAFGPSLGRGGIGPDDFTIEILPQAAEESDGVADLYKRSFLYLVSRALERRHKTPLLGLRENWWMPPKQETPQARAAREANDKLPDVQAWKAAWGTRPDPVELHDPYAVEFQDDQGLLSRQFKLSHCNMDRSIRMLQSAQERMLRDKTGKRPALKHQITDLCGS